MSNFKDYLRQSLHEQDDPFQQQRDGWYMLCAILGVCNSEQYRAWIAKCPPCAEYGRLFWKQWGEDGTVPDGHQDLPQHGGTFDDLEDHVSQMPTSTNAIQISGNNNNQIRYPAGRGYSPSNNVTMREVYDAGYQQALNEQEQHPLGPFQTPSMGGRSLEDRLTQANSGDGGPYVPVEVDPTDFGTHPWQKGDWFWYRGKRWVYNGTGFDSV